MIEIPEPPTRSGCASCAKPLSWLYSPLRETWICLVPTSDTTFELHRCPHAQDRTLWRSLPTGDPPSDTYLEAKAKISTRSGSG